MMAEAQDTEIRQQVVQVLGDLMLRVIVAEVGVARTSARARDLEAELRARIDQNG